MSIATNLQRLVTAKSDIADAITAKGGTVNQGDGFEEFAEDIASIPSGGSGEFAYENNYRWYLGDVKCTPKQVKPVFEPELPVRITWYAESSQSVSVYRGRIWTDGEDVFYYDSSNSKHYMLNKSVSTSTNLSWKEVTITSSISFDNLTYTRIWSDGTNTYYSYGSTQYVWNKSTFSWDSKTWKGLTSFTGSYTWTDGSNIYLSVNDSNYILNKETSTWSAKTWIRDISLDGRYIWTDGVDVYFSGYSSGIKHRVLDKSTSTWSTKEWNNVPSNMVGTCIWTDGVDVYYSYESSQYVLDKSTSTWVQKTWNGLTSFYGEYTWIANGNVYYSYTDGNTYVLDRATSTWNTVTSMGLLILDVDNAEIWTDGNDVFYGGSYVLNKGTFVWSPKTWYGLSGITGKGIWTDHTNIFYSYGSGTSGSSYKHYILDKATYTWYSVTWSGAAYYNKCFCGNNIWSDDTDTYLSTYPTPGTSSSTVYHFHLTKSPTLNDRTGTWEYASWGGGSSGSSTYIFTSVWTDGTKMPYGLAIIGTGKNGTNYVWTQYTIGETKSWYNNSKIFYTYAQSITTDGFQMLINGYPHRTSSSNPNLYDNSWTDGDRIYCSQKGTTNVSSRQYILPKFIGLAQPD